MIKENHCLLLLIGMEQVMSWIYLEMATAIRGKMLMTLKKSKKKTGYLSRDSLMDHSKNQEPLRI